jgi:A/G-specific adenine glycosylase
LDHVLKNWAGLGYYARARNLHRCAQIVVDQYQGVFPSSVALLSELPGIGRSTAGAIAAMAYHQQAAILDGNVKRVLCRFQAIEGSIIEAETLKELCLLSEMLTPKHRVSEYTQAMMDLGALICTRSKPQCEHCPLQKNCLAFQLDRVSEFPFKKPKKVLPIKTTQMLLIKNSKQEILLYQRNLQGIWGGLWSLPEITLQHNIADWCHNELDLEINHIQIVDAFRHTFTHYHLDIHPVIIKTTTARAMKPWRWCNQTILKTLGLPKPVSYLLNTYP